MKIDALRPALRQLLKLDSEHTASEFAVAEQGVTPQWCSDPGGFLLHACALRLHLRPPAAPHWLFALERAACQASPPNDRLRLIMPNHIARAFKALPLSAHLVWLMVLLIFPCVHWYAGNPDMTDRPLERSEGRIAWVGSLKSGYELLLQPNENARKYERLYIYRGRTTVPEKSLIRMDEQLNVERYGDLIANCWVGGKQVCFSRCGSDLQCKQEQRDHDLLVLPWGFGITLFAYLFTLVWVACGGRVMPNPRNL